MSRVGKNTVASVATFMCMVMVFSSILPLFAVQNTYAASVVNASVTGTKGYIGPDESGWYVSNVTVALSAPDASYIQYILDSKSPVNYTSAVLITDGIHTLRYYCFDGAGNKGPESESMFKVDTQVPVTNYKINGNLSPVPYWYNGTVTVNLTASDNGASKLAWTSYNLNNTGWKQYNNTNITIYEGMNTLEYSSYDWAGNHDDKTVTINVSNPIVTVKLDGDLIPNNGWYKSDVQVTLTASGGVGGIDHIEYHWNGTTAWTSVSGNTATLFVTDEGYRELSYRAMDSKGIYGDKKVQSIGVDKAGPSITIDPQGNKVSGGWYEGDVTINIYVKDSGHINYTEYSWDQTNWKRYDGSFKVGQRSSGTIYARTFDMAGYNASTRRFIQFPPASYNQGSMSNSVWINGQTIGPGSGSTSDQSETPEYNPTSTPIPLPTPELVPSPTPAAETTTGSNSLLALAVLIGVMAIIIVAAAAVYFFMLKPK